MGDDHSKPGRVLKAGSAGRWSRRRDGAQELSGASRGDSGASGRKDVPTETLCVLTFFSQGWEPAAIQLSPAVLKQSECLTGDTGMKFRTLPSPE